MLTEKRYELILKLLDEQNSVTVAEIKEKLNKVFGGAVAI